MVKLPVLVQVAVTEFRFRCGWNSDVTSFGISPPQQLGSVGAENCTSEMERVKYVSFSLILFFLFRCWLIYGVAQVSKYITPLLTRQVHIERCVFPKDGLSPKKQIKPIPAS